MAKCFEGLNYQGWPKGMWFFGQGSKISLMGIVVGNERAKQIH